MPKRARVYLLIVGTLALLSRLFGSPLQAWYKTLSPHDLTIIKVVVLVTFFLVVPGFMIFLSRKDSDA